MSDKQNNGFVYRDWETKSGRRNHSSILTTLGLSWQLNAHEEMSQRQAQISACEGDMYRTERSIWISRIKRINEFGLVNEIICFFFFFMLSSDLFFFPNMLDDIFLLEKCFMLGILQQIDLHQDYHVVSCIWKSKHCGSVLKIWAVVNSCSLCSFPHFYSVSIFWNMYLLRH